MLKELSENWNKYCSEENFIGIGSTRKVYRVDEYVIKLHLHKLGYKQSQNELHIYNVMAKKGLHELFAKVYYVDETISIQKYYQPLELKNHQSFEIDGNIDAQLIPDLYEEVLELLDQDFDCFDLKDSSNYGMNEQGKLTFIDYGMSKNLYTNSWVPLAEAGIIPQIDVEVCGMCGLKKELRMYGDHDLDQRCYSCGKE